MSKKVVVLLFIFIFTIPYLSGSIQTKNLLVQDEGSDLTNSNVQVDDDPFDEIEDELPDFFTAKNLMRDFKVLSLIIMFILSILMSILVRKYIKDKYQDPLKVFVISSTLLNFFAWILTSALYYMAVYYEWFNMNSLNSAIHDSELWNLISKTLSTGIGTFYIAHLIDVFLAGTLIYFLITVISSFYKRRV